MKEIMPKIIHFIWVGNQPKPELVLACIESWRQWLPDYEIMEWGNQDLEKIDNQYVTEAFEAKKWAFVSDYLRLYALYNYGGIYLDSDVRVTKSLDSFLDHDFFSGYENYKSVFFPITAVMGAKKKNSIIKNLLDEYDGLSFITADGSYNLETNTSRISRYFDREFGLKPPYDGQNRTELADNIVLYPSYYFCTPDKGKINYAIHLFNGSWVDGFSRKLKFVLGNYSLIRFKREHYRNNTMPLSLNEKILFSVKVSSKKTYSLIKKKGAGI